MRKMLEKRWASTINNSIMELSCPVESEEVTLRVRVDWDQDKTQQVEAVSG